MQRVHVYITGRVQGVSYRANTQMEAGKLGLTGWVRNLSDGRVGALFEGEEEQVEKMLEWCREGSALARVENVKIDGRDEIEERAFDNFEIKR